MTVKGLTKKIHATDHYENFPVASFIIPKKLKKHFISVYNFARLADDIADEGEIESGERIRLLQLFDDVLNNKKSSLSNADNVSMTERKIITTANSAKHHLAELGVSNKSLSKLLIAFRHDANFTVFESWQKVFEYCENSANPIGRILLGIFGITNSQKNQQNQLDILYLKSDAICTGLQIVNFAQDAAEDDKRGRPTFPKEIWPQKLQGMQKYRFSTLSNAEKANLIENMVLIGRQKLSEGSDLPKLLMNRDLDHSFRCALEISLIIECGLHICEKITANPNIVWSKPPRLKLLNLPKLFFSALLNVILKG
ncbi:MAG: hypothetical protein CBC01_02140 [Betaproteobacteria bacterium TMED41]|nr:MAG: hypothetical protein CBC01_02140 [Betaproteobacteria bacterium TMED41]